MKRKELDSMVARLNNLTGSPVDPYTRQPDGSYTANVGNYHISEAYGGFALERMATVNGGVLCISHDGYGTKTQLGAFLRAFMDGIEA